MSTTMRAARAASVCAVVLWTLCGCKPAAQGETAPMFVEDHGLITVPADSPLRSHLAVAAVSPAGLARGLQTPAVVEADPAFVTNVLTPLAGRVTDLKVRLGDRVRRGQALMVIASGDLAQANADVQKAQDAHDLAAKALTRARGVKEAGGAAQKDLEAAESGEVQAKAELDRAKVRLASLTGSATVRGDTLVLTAPIDGVVTSLVVGAGQQLSDPTATVMTIANTSHLFVTANLDEADAGQVSRGAPADIALAAYPGQVIHGRVSEIDALLQPDTRRQKVRIWLDNADGRLLPNMYATVTFQLAPSAGRDGAFVPQSALLMNNDTISVFVEVRPWVFQRRVVRLGDETDTDARVLSGVTPGERVIVRGGVLLND
jgi:cobalt-zinc-cadmium efflux system membrane fusion protein